jgi:hypothetical protein
MTLITGLDPLNEADYMDCSRFVHNSVTKFLPCKQRKKSKLHLVVDIFVFIHRCISSKGETEC